MGKVKRSLTMGDAVKKSDKDIENGDHPQVVFAPTRSKEI